ncbi:MAG: hypothetical protein V1766_00670 [Pseudomonadota bacterium]
MMLRANIPAQQMLRLPKIVESDPRGSQLLHSLTTYTQPLWRESGLGIPTAMLSFELTEALRNAYASGQVIRSLECAKRRLASEERGLQMADRQTGVRRGVRISRLIILANDGAERFYRNVETMLLRHGLRVLAVRLETDASELGELLFGHGRIARLVMLERKQAVGTVLLAMAGSLDQRQPALKGAANKP